jgi:hypothetical protein
MLLSKGGVSRAGFAGRVYLRADYLWHQVAGTIVLDQHDAAIGCDVRAFPLARHMGPQRAHHPSVAHDYHLAALVGLREAVKHRGGSQAHVVLAFTTWGPPLPGALDYEGWILAHTVIGLTSESTEALFPKVRFDFNREAEMLTNDPRGFTGSKIGTGDDRRGAEARSDDPARPREPVCAPVRLWEYPGSW